MTSPVPPRAYCKHDSFLGMRHRAPTDGEVLGRLVRVRDALGTPGKSDYATGVVRQACDELLEAAAVPEGAARFQLQTYVIEEISRLTDAELPRYLFYRYRYEVYPQRKLLDDYPPCLQIEPTSVCNFRCVFCYQQQPEFSHAASGQLGLMSLELFQRLIDQAEGQCEAVTLASRGEPLLCRQLPEMLAYARGKFLALKLNTNASRLTEAACHAILEAEVNTVVFSVDAADAATYERLRVGGRFDEVRANIERFHRIRAARYPCSRVITRVSGVRVPGTPDLDRMASEWEGLVDQVAFVAYNPWEGVYEHPETGIETACSDLWRRMFVWWDGTVNPCDVDYRSTLRVGSAQQEPLAALWRSEAYEQLRARHLAGRRSACSPCNRCSVI